MSRLEEKLKVKQLLVDAITLLCRSGMRFENKFCIEALVAITLDERDVVVININETVDIHANDKTQAVAENEPKNDNYRNERLGCPENSQILENVPDNKLNFPTDNYYESGRFSNLNSDINAEDNVRQIKYERESITDETDNYTGEIEQNNCPTIIAEETDDGDDCLFVKSECIDDKIQDWSAASTDFIDYSAIDPNSCMNASTSYHFHGDTQRKSRVRDRSLVNKPKWKPPNIPTHNRPRYGINSSSVLLQEQDPSNNNELTMEKIGRPMMQCTFCSLVFTHANSLREHVNGVHLMKKMFRCPDCGESFKWRAELSKHKRLLCPHREGTYFPSFDSVRNS